MAVELVVAGDCDWSSRDLVVDLTDLRLTLTSSESPTSTCYVFLTKETIRDILVWLNTASYPPTA